ncbi:class I SAM-dependent RNA methyltransferase [Flagellimonas taeanensis]|jgi:putative N6-adenine-specific DNA methylase|uniref:N6-adenine-specific DNA methylase n=1 Tax=Flagellimonas taeanensis TaxID=1005926 RepID=A0A1M7C7Q1_9FLAO|nr:MULTISPECIES: THUMP domain-containing protein [Allomuricauda]MDC6386891.1 THUMP domain-containing protein [Muricauda sp. SK9]MEE1964553.1 THUMP domain-containing protein [Allomuricauda taeanensis]RIV50609.1 class I SAM-dependent RNA methyltransferase [Allomuricauda taeanensis]SFC60993.1 putative N6-adenine-specific DNA methylase [Allomuricauda taeanensis]SHL63332.1 putative N6-adenine-specific DNA methylase [Allomuricauda taeanensis]
MAGNFKMMAKTLYGFEPLLAKELRNLGAGRVEEGVRNVTFEGDTGFMYKANLCLRTALKVYKPISTFRVFNEKDLYRSIYELDWPHFFGHDKTFAIDTTMSSEVFNNSMFVSLKAKDAIVDKFREVERQRPNVDSQDPDVRINIHIHENTCTVSLDSSGNSLHQRGYRILTNIAPINEVLAAGLLLASSWDGHTDFLDPMCGSGTFLIEAAMIACNIPANINREAYAFMHWKDYDAELHEKIVEASLKKTREFHHKIIGYDKAPSAVRKAQENVENANLAEYITIERKDFFRTEKPVEGKLHMVFNPPYGERLPIEVDEFYAKIGDTLKQQYPGTDAWMITSNLEALKHVGLRPSRKIKAYNGKLEARLVKYEIYEGSKKAKYQQ